MNDRRYKELMTKVGVPNKKSLLIALKQVANEVEQECKGDYEHLEPDALPVEYNTEFKGEIK